MKQDKITLSLALLLIVTLVSWITSCTHNPNIDALPEVCFDDVLRIYSSNCAKPNCHDGTGETGTAFNNYTDIRNSVVPGDPDASRSYKAIIATWGENKMPPDEPISLDNRTTIRVWIEQGALEIPCPVATASYDGLLSEHRISHSE